MSSLNTKYSWSFNSTLEDQQTNIVKHRATLAWKKPTNQLLSINAKKAVWYHSLANLWNRDYFVIPTSKNWWWLLFEQKTTEIIWVTSCRNRCCQMPHTRRAFDSVARFLIDLTICMIFAVWRWMSHRDRLQCVAKFPCLTSPHNYSEVVGLGYKQGVKVQNCKVISQSDFQANSVDVFEEVLACQQPADFTTLCKRSWPLCNAADFVSETFSERLSRFCSMLSFIACKPHSLHLASTRLFHALNVAAVL